MPKTLSTHATRNPTRAVQQPRQRTKSTASKNTNTLAASNRGAKKRALEDDIEEFYVDFQDKVAALAIKHDRKQQYIKKRLSNGAQFKQRRAANIRNAIMHDISKKAKEGRLSVFFFSLLHYLPTPFAQRETMARSPPSATTFPKKSTWKSKRTLPPPNARA
jgi:hypothetical protein